MNALPNKLPEQMLVIAERVSIAAHLGQWFSPALKGVVLAERHFWRTFNHG
jgi:hypothetical protein